MPGELFVEYQLAAQKMRPDHFVCMAAYADPRRIDQLERHVAGLDLLLTRSELSTRSYAEEGFPVERMVRVPETGVDLEAFPMRDAYRSEGPLRALHLSQMSLIKGVGRLFEAWNRLEGGGLDLVLVGTMDAQVAAVQRELAPRDVRHEGPTSDPGRWYRDADVFVSPSVADMGPATVLEAMASGTPVVVSDACGASEVVTHGQDGFVYRHDHPEELAAHLEFFRKDRSRIEQFGRAARRAAEARPRTAFAESLVAALAGGGA